MPKFSAITFSLLKLQIEEYLKAEHNKAGILFSPASPYGQILSVVENLHQLSILYLKNAINQFDLGDANSNNERVIKNVAILAGHIPFRSISATGTLRLVKKSGLNEDDLPNGVIKLKNQATLKNKTNALFYSLDLGKSEENLFVSGSSGVNQFFVRIIQGQWRQATFTGDGRPLQTYSVQDSDAKDVENFNVEVLVNGQYWTIKKHIYDLLPDEQACVVRTGFNGGVDVVFGNGGFGAIPPIVSSIGVRYLQSDGAAGNIYRRTINDWRFVDDVFDSTGQDIDIEKIFDIEIYNDINFGNEREDYRFTKSLLPIATNNFVLALPQHYVYELKKLGIFTLVNAEEKGGTIYIYAVPDIRLFKRSNESYFTIPLSNEKINSTGYASQTINSSAFELDSYERKKILNYLRSGGLTQLTKNFVIRTPKMSFYIMEVKVVRYSSATTDSVKSQVVSLMSDYFLNLTRLTRIPKSDIIKTLLTASDIYSVDCRFISKKNEDYHKSANENITIVNGLAQYPQSYDPAKTPGLDPILGDIIFEADELPVLRGGWYDRQGGYYKDGDPNTMNNGPIVYLDISEVRKETTEISNPKIRK
jgi:hypothetical protein